MKKTKIIALTATLLMLIGMTAGCSFRAGVGTTPSPRAAVNDITNANA